LKARPFLELGNVRVYNDDFLKTSAVEDDSVDLTVTSPPYNVDIKYESYDDSIPYEKYCEFSREWLRRCYDLTKDDGRLCLNVPLDKNKGGHQSVSQISSQPSLEQSYSLSRTPSSRPRSL
jgi:site-specific DNA-methyltransferase (adenine-specific)